MKEAKLHKLLDDGAVLTVTAVGVSFKSSYFPKDNRQDNIKVMKDKLMLEGRLIQLIKEPKNEYDSNAILLVYEGLDIGYIPKNTTVNITTATRKNRRASVDGFNKILNAYDTKLIALVKNIYGGYNGKHYGVSIDIMKI